MTSSPSASAEMPTVGDTVNLRWLGHWITAEVKRDRGDGLLDLHVPGIPDAQLLAVGRGRSGWIERGAMWRFFDV